MIAQVIILNRINFFNHRCVSHLLQSVKLTIVYCKTKWRLRNLKTSPRNPTVSLGRYQMLSFMINVLFFLSRRSSLVMVIDESFQRTDETGLLGNVPKKFFFFLVV